MGIEQTRAVLGEPPRVVNVGLELFAEALQRQQVSVVQVEWQPPAGGDARLAAVLARLTDGEADDRAAPASGEPGHRDGPAGAAARIDTANATAVGRLLDSQPVLVDVRTAGDVLPGMTGDHVLHAGPPIAWDAMCPLQRGAVVVGAIYEGLAGDPAEAMRRLAEGVIRIAPCHAHGAVGPMTGIITASMPVLVVEHRAAGNRAYATINEGMGKVLRFGATQPEVLERLRWMRDELAPALRDAIVDAAGLDLNALIAQALQMGDELHMRNLASTALFVRAIAPHLTAALRRDGDRLDRVMRFLSRNNDQFFLNLAMGAAKAGADAAHGVPDSSLVTAIARNGTELGLRVSGLGDRWFTGPADLVQGLYFPGYSAEDACRDIGDSAIMETVGLGGMAMATAPALVPFLGLSDTRAALQQTQMAREITLADHAVFLLPALSGQGTPVGIDVRKVVETGITPLINTAIAHREPGIGQIGAGVAHAPPAAFLAALEALAEAIN
jgi:hypothetical protein